MLNKSTIFATENPTDNISPIAPIASQFTTQLDCPPKSFHSTELLLGDFHFPAIVYTKIKADGKELSIAYYIHLKALLGNKQGIFHNISIDYLAKLVGVRYNTIRTHLSILEQYGLLTYKNKTLHFKSIRNLTWKGSKFKMVKSNASKTGLIRVKRKSFIKIKYYKDLKTQILIVKNWCINNNLFHQRLKPNNEIPTTDGNISKQFYSGITCRSAGQLINRSHQTANRNIKKLEKLGVFRVTKMYKFHGKMNISDFTQMKRDNLLPNWAINTSFGALSITRNKIELKSYNYPHIKETNIITNEIVQNAFNILKHNKDCKKNEELTFVNDAFFVDAKDNYLPFDRFISLGYVSKSWIMKSFNLSKQEVNSIFINHGYTLLPKGMKSNNPKYKIKGKFIINKDTDNEIVVDDTIEVEYDNPIKLMRLSEAIKAVRENSNITTK